MNPDIPHNDRDELEVKLTALLLGELSAEETSALQQAIQQDAELARLHDRLKLVIGLVRETAVTPAGQMETQPAPLRLSEDRRQKLLAQFKTVKPKEFAPQSRRFTVTLLEVAAVLAIMAMLAAMLLPALSKAKARAQRSPASSFAILNNLRQLDGAKQQWALEQGKSGTDAPTFKDIEPYLGRGAADKLPSSAAGETYVLGRVEDSVVAELDASAARKTFGRLPASSPAGGTPGQRVQLSADGDYTYVARSAAASPRAYQGQVEGETGQAQTPGLATGAGGQQLAAAGGQSQTGANPAFMNQPAVVPPPASVPQATIILPALARSGEAGPGQGGIGGGGGFGGAGPGSRDRVAGSSGFPGFEVGGGAPATAAQPGASSLPAAGRLGQNPDNVALAEGQTQSRLEVPTRNFRTWSATDSGVANRLALATPAQSPPPENAREKAVAGVLTLNQADSKQLGLTLQDRIQQPKPGTPAELPSATAQQRTSAIVLPPPTAGVPFDPGTLNTFSGRENSVAIADDATREGVRRMAAGAATLKSASASDNFKETAPVPARASEASKASSAKAVGYLNVPAPAQTDLAAAGGSTPTDVSATRVTQVQKTETGQAYSDATRKLEDRGAKQQQAIAQAQPEVEQLRREPGAEQADLAPAKPALPPPVPQPEIQTRDNPFSTFSLNVSDVSFKLAQASLQQGVLPEPGSIRSEEFINAFDYRDPEPAPGAPIGFAWERAADPFAHNRDLLRFSVKTAASGRQAGRPLNIVLLLDNSGSMERADRVRIIHEALRVLASQLQPQDILSVVIFARTAHLWVDGLPGSQAAAVVEGLDSLTPQGGTNLEEAMKLAYETALRHYLANGINRVVLLTDGAANLGNVDPETLKQRVEANRKQGIALDCFGIGWEGYNDDLLEVLSRNGDGRYGFINSPEEAATEFAGQLAGALQVAASDVKVQVEFNPARVTAYRQIGYARHQLTKEQFRDNTVDAAEIGAAESGNALYVIEVSAGGQGPLGTVRVRYKVPGTTDYREQAWVVPYTGSAVPLEQASPAMRLAATASAFSEWLAASPYAAEVTPDRLLGCLVGVPEVYGADTRPKQLEWMIRQAGGIAGK